MERNASTFSRGREGGRERRGNRTCHVPGRTPALYKLLPSFLMRRFSSAHVRVSSLNLEDEFRVCEMRYDLCLRTRLLLPPSSLPASLPVRHCRPTWVELGGAFQERQR